MVKSISLGSFTDNFLNKTRLFALNILPPSDSK